MTESAKTEEKPKKEKKISRESYILKRFAENETRVEVIAKELEELLNQGKLLVNELLRKAPMSYEILLSQVKWYLIQAHKKGKMTEEVAARYMETKKNRPQRKLKVKVEVAQPAEVVSAKPADEEVLGTL